MAKAQREVSKLTKKFIMGRNYLINEMTKKMNQFKFQDFDGDYKEYLKARRQMFEYQINEWKNDIKMAILMDTHDELPVGSVY